jgi:hypothetical protein
MQPETPVAPVNYDSLLERLWKNRASTFEFQVDGVLFHIQNVPEGADTRFHISAEIGFMPFTQESAPRRMMLMTILSYTVHFPTARFDLGPDGKITVSEEVLISEAEAPEMCFSRIIFFIQQTMPYIRLIGTILP